jgi:hypothetical protein
MPLLRKDLEARYELFEQFALQDQRRYYSSISKRHRTAASQVNRVRAGLSLLTGLAAAAAALIVQSAFVPGAICYVSEANPTASFPPQCGLLQQLTGIFTVMAIALPAFGALFSTLADLYQWDRLITIYDAALQNIEVADAQSPDETVPDDVTYRAAFLAYTEGTLSVMSDETAQWGQAIRTPAQLETYLSRAEERARTAERRVQGKASQVIDSANTSASSDNPTPPTNAG